jgi:hypothetical protein
LGDNPRVLGENSARTSSETDAMRGRSYAQRFRVSNTPVVADGSREDVAATETSEDLPRFYGTGALVLLPRDPERFIAFWDIDWSAVFKDVTAGEHAIHLRVYLEDGTQEATLTVEPMRGMCDVAVAIAGGSYYVQLGYAGPNNNWQLIAQSPIATAPLSGASANEDSDFATIPFHLSFQRLTEIFRRATKPAETLVQTIARIERKAADGGQANISTEELKMLETAGINASQLDDVLRAYRNARSLSRDDSPSLFERELAKITPLGDGLTSASGGVNSASQPPPR